MLIIGHRGAKGLAPENTISSFQKAQEHGVDMIEADIRKGVGKIVVSHDKLTDYSSVATLQDILSTFQMPLNLEVKEAGIEAEILNALKGFSSEVLVSSKKLMVLKKVRALDENVKLGLILGSANFWLLPLIPWLDKNLRLYSVHPKWFLAQKRVVRFLKGLGKQVFVWTVNSEKKMSRMRELNVHGVFTDYPNLIKK